MSWSWRMNLSALLVVAGCTESGRAPVLDDRAALEAYQRYQSQIAKDANLRIDVAVLEPAHRIRPRELAGLLRNLPASPYLVPYFTSMAVRPGDGITTALHPTLERWGQNGYPANDAAAATSLDIATGPTIGTRDANVGAPDACADDSCCTETTMEGPIETDVDVPTGGGGGSDGGGSGGDTGGDGYGGALGFREIDGVPLFTSRTMPSGRPIAASRLRVTLTAGEIRHGYDALVLHYASGLPVIVDRVLFGINEQLAPAGLGEIMQHAESPWWKTGDGCQAYAFSWGKNMSWRIRNLFNITVAIPWVEASAGAELTCAVYDKPNNGGKGCRTASATATPGTSGAGANYCGQNWYVTPDSASGKDPIKGADGNNIGVDFSVGAAAYLVNSDSAKVVVKLEGKAEGKQVGGNGQVNVKFDHPGGSYGGVDVSIDGEVICPDYVAP